MSAGVGTPIRLVRGDGNLIYLNADTLTMSVDRTVGGVPIPWSHGRRLGMDLNMSRASIVIGGVLVDDAVDRRTLGTQAFCDIDFAANINLFGWFDADILTSTFPAPATFEEWVVLTDSGPNQHYFQLTNGTVVGTIGSTTDPNGVVNGAISVGVGDATTTAAVASALSNAINEVTHPSGLSAGFRPGSHFLSSLKDSQIVSAALGGNGFNSRLSINMLLEGDFGGSSPSFAGWSATDTSGPLSIPLHSFFRGGKSNTISKSAGDKAMDLWGVLNNMNNNNGAGHALSKAVIASIVAPIGGLGLARKTMDLLGASDIQEDYIIGIQIPYHSLIQASGSDDLVQRNFFMPTGKKQADQKGSEANTKDVSSKFIHYADSEYTGMKGTIQQFILNYDAGATVYEYQMTFVPIDFIL